MLNQNKKITIGITAYKEGVLLEEAWKSVVDQTNSQWEAVMVLDGGADKKTKQVFNGISHPFLKSPLIPACTMLFNKSSLKFSSIPTCSILFTISIFYFYLRYADRTPIAPTSPITTFTQSVVLGPCTGDE